MNPWIYYTDTTTSDKVAARVATTKSKSKTIPIYNVRTNRNLVKWKVKKRTIPCNRFVLTLCDKYLKNIIAFCVRFASNEIHASKLKHLHNFRISETTRTQAHTHIPTLSVCMCLRECVHARSWSHRIHKPFGTSLKSGTQINISAFGSFEFALFSFVLDWRYTPFARERTHSQRWNCVYLRAQTATATVGWRVFFLVLVSETCTIPSSWTCSTLKGLFIYGCSHHF